MKNRYLVIAFMWLSISCLQVIFAWGMEAHKLINIKAIELLPEEMRLMNSWKDYIGEHASDADIRRDTKQDTTEWPRHFIDIDYYSEFLDGKMIQDKNQLISIYGEDTVTRMGLLPWATFDTYNRLVQSFMEKRLDKILIYISDLGHYVGDGYQPFHTSLNYNGQLSDQKGIHGRYESEMINKYIDKITNSIQLRSVNYIANPLDYVFNYLTVSNSVSPIIFNADKLAYKQTESHGSSDYYRLMWFRTEYITIDLLSNASGALASLIYSAWIDAGKPNLNDLN
ncbi:MAG: hypothetical protein HXY50_09105 [Ignavibacteriaceae bacterium]|nr:hypothetical protein [Ignavibacteriaceae bacterium]